MDCSCSAAGIMHYIIPSAAARLLAFVQWGLGQREWSPACRRWRSRASRRCPSTSRRSSRRGLPAFVIVGLPDKAITRSRRAGPRGADVASGLSLPPKRVIVNLAPADLPKEGSHYDLPIALALMAAIGAFPADALEGYLALGELGLDGRLAPTSGVLPAAIAAHARELGIICPAPSGPEAAWAGDDIEIVAPGLAARAGQPPRRLSALPAPAAQTLRAERRPARSRATCAARRWRVARSRWPPRAAITC